MLLALLLLALLYAPPVTMHAQSLTPTPIPVSDDAVNAVARNLYCPVCENTPLEVCPTQACIEWRATVRELLAEGETEDQVRQYFIAHFGMRTVGTPTDPTSLLLTVGLPFTLIIVAGLFIGGQLWRWYRARPKIVIVTDEAITFHIAESTGPENPVDSETAAYRARIESELRKG